ncbi:MAG: hypothetical protein NWF06_01725 [Candidatus Bathyarchaeota archaeon]|nr:hypothetical protein [Candidatus Bathyarchaeum sp.]
MNQIIRVSQKEIINHFPSWFPRNEWAFKSYLIRNPSIIGENLEFVGYEIFRSDLLFRRGSNYFVIEAKFGSNPKMLDAAATQLKRYMFKFCNFERNITPLVALLSDENPVRFNPDAYVNRLFSLKSTAYKTISAENHLKSLNKIVSERLHELKSLKSEIEFTKLELNELRDRKKRIEAEIEGTKLRSSDSNFDAYLRDQIILHDLKFKGNYEN